MTQSATFGAVPTGIGQQVREDFNASDQAQATEHEGVGAPPVTYPFMLWRNDTAKLLRRRNTANDAWEIIQNYGATADPTINDDAADGYIRGAVWINVADDRVFFCTNPSMAAATWAQVGIGGGGGVASVFGRSGAVAATPGDYTADHISDGGGKVIMTAAERTALASISFPTKVITLKGTASSADNANIRAAIAAIKASGQPGEILMSGDFMIGHAGDLTGIDPDSCPDLRLTGRGSCRWYKGVAATTAGLTGGSDPGDGTAYRMLSRATDDGAGKVLIIRNMIFEGDLEATLKQLGDASRLIALDHYDRVELIDVEGRWSSQMGFTFGYCNVVRGNRVYLNRIARDGFNASNCADMMVTDSRFEWIIDDCCAANLSALNVGDRGQQRAFVFTNNRVYNAQGCKLLGGRHVLISANSFHAPVNYAVYVGSDASYGEGGRPIEDLLITNNNVTDLIVADHAGISAIVDTGILVSQTLATPKNVVIRGNSLAQRTTTTGLTWSQLKLRGISAENRQWRRNEADGNILWYDPALVSEIFVRAGKAIRIEAPNGLDRLTYDVDDNRYDGFSDDAFLRSQSPVWTGTQGWAVPASLGEVPVGASARASGLDLRGYQQMRLVVKIGAQGGSAGSQLQWLHSLDGSIWVETAAIATLDGNANQTIYGPWVPIPAGLRQAIDTRVALYGHGGNGATQVTILEFQLDIRGLDQTSAARLLPPKVTAAEIANPVGEELRSFSVADVAAIHSADDSQTFQSVQIGTRTYLTENDDGFWLTSNAYWDGSNWLRVDVSKWAFALNVRTAQPIPYEAATGGAIFWRASPGANPINPVHAAADGWLNSYLMTEFGDLVIGGYGIEVDGNGTFPYARLLHYSDGAPPHLSGILTNLFLSLTAVDDPAVASWFFGRKDDSFVVARAAPGAVGAGSLTTLLEVTATGKVLGTPYDVLCGIAGKPGNAEVVLLFAAPRAFRIPANAAGSQLKAGTAATGESVFSVQKNGVQFLTATVAATGTTASFAGSQTEFAAGDVLRIAAPATADGTLADIAITLVATLI